MPAFACDVVPEVLVGAALGELDSASPGAGASIFWRRGAELAVSVVLGLVQTLNECGCLLFVTWNTAGEAVIFFGETSNRGSFGTPAVTEIVRSRVAQACNAAGTAAQGARARIGRQR